MKIVRTLRFKVAIILASILVFFFLGITVINRYFVIEDIKNDISNNVIVRQEKIDESFTLVIDAINLLFSPMVANENLTEMTQNDLSIETRQNYYNQLIKQLPIDHKIFGDIIIAYDNEIYHSKKPDDSEYVYFDDLNFVDKVLTSEKNFVQGDILLDTSGNKYLLFGKNFSKYYFPNIDCCVVFCSKYEVFKDCLQNMTNKDSYDFLVSDTTKIILHPITSYVGSIIFESEIFQFTNGSNYHIQEIDQEKSLVVVSKCQKIFNQYGLTWHIVSVISYNSLFNNLETINTYNIVIGIIGSLIAIVIALFVSNNLTKSIKNLNDRMNIYATTGKITQVQISKDEIAELEKTFDHLIQTITELIERNNFEQEEKRKLELDALQLQINPHFLYNTLDAIAWIAKIKKQQEIERLVIALAQFFRISLHKGDKFITVQEEIELIQNFIEIELIRFPGKFKIEYHISNEVKKYDTMKLILQPIVENAIKHGIAPCEKEGLIIINAYQEGNYIIYEVIDNGIGFNNEKDILQIPSTSKSGYGLKNVNERIKLEYGDKSGITVFSKENEGTKVTIKIEIKKE